MHIGRYEILGRIGSGGFATVYRARDPVLDSEVAVKVLADNWSDNPEIRNRFMREAQILRRIDSDRVVTVHDIGEAPTGQPYFVMALADGGTLERRLQAGVQPTVPEIATVARAIAECVGVVHAHGLIHRDLKPSNLLVAGSGRGREAGAPVGLLDAGERLVLGDFGLAKDIELHTTGLTIAAGSGGYAAPEQMALAGTPSRRTDFYAATAVLYRVVSGTRPPVFDLADRTIPFPVGAWWLEGPLGQFFRRGMAYETEFRHAAIEAWLAEILAALDRYRTLAAGAAAPTSELPSVSPFSATPAPPVLPSSGPVAAVPLVAPPAAGPSLAGQPAVGSPLVAPPPLVAAPVEPERQPPPPAVERPAWSPPPMPPEVGVGARRVGHPLAARRGRRAITIVAALVLAAVLAASLLWAVLPVGPAIEGPDTIVAGQSAEYRATFDGADTFEWTDPAGARRTQPSLRVDAWVPGTVRIRVRAITGDSGSAETVRSIAILPAPDGPVIEGPGEIDGPTIYRFTYAGDWTSAVWILPDGSEAEGEQFEVTPRSPGTVRLVLLLTRNDGTRIGTAREIRIAG